MKTVHKNYCLNNKKKISIASETYETIIKDLTCVIKVLEADEKEYGAEKCSKKGLKFPQLGKA